MNGRKNHLLAASDEGEERAACFGSFYITTGLPSEYPKGWIEDVFEKIEHIKTSKYHTLIPQNWGKQSYKNFLSLGQDVVDCGDTFDLN